MYFMKSLFKNSNKVFNVYIKKSSSSSESSISKSLTYCRSVRVATKCFVYAGADVMDDELAKESKRRRKDQRKRTGRRRKLDYENFLCSILLPEKIRSTAIVIRAFNIELSKIQEQTSEKATGIMRAEFWKESINNVYSDKPPQHPVLIEIHKATKRHRLSKFHFRNLLTTRMKQLNVSTFKDMTDMENYADNTCSPVLMLLLEASDVRDVNCDHVASHLGRAQGLCNLIRSLPFNLKEKVVLLPRTELLKHSISEESLMRNTVDPDKLSQIIFEIASKANNHLKLANSLQEKVPKECKIIFLPAVPLRLFLNKLEKYNFNIYDPEFRKKSGLLPLHLYWSKFRNCYS